MLILVICHPDSDCISGFTLLELIAVLFILSLLAGLTAPRLTTMYDSLQRTLERDEVLARLGELNYLAFQQGSDFELTIYPLEQKIKDNSETENSTENINESKKETIKQLPLEFPKGWQVRTEVPIHFHANGVCSGGIAYLQYQDQEFRVQLEPPFCKPQLL